MKAAMFLFLLSSFSLSYAMDIKNSEFIANAMTRHMNRFMALDSSLDKQALQVHIEAVRSSFITNKKSYTMLLFAWKNELELIEFIRQEKKHNIIVADGQTNEPSAKRRKVS